MTLNDIAEVAKEWRETEMIYNLRPGVLAILACECRQLADDGIDLNDEAAIRKALRDRGLDYEPRYLDVLVRVAKDFSIERHDNGTDDPEPHDQTFHGSLEEYERAHAEWLKRNPRSASAVSIAMARGHMDGYDADHPF